SEILLEPRERVRRELDQRFDPQLLAVLAVHFHASAHAYTGAEGHSGKGPHDGETVGAAPHGELDHPTAGFAAFVGDALDHCFDARPGPHRDGHARPTAAPMERR